MQTTEGNRDSAEVQMKLEQGKRDLRKRLCRFYCIALLHMIIPAYGLAILIFQNIPTWRLS